MKILIIGPIPIKYGGKELGGVCTHITGLTDNLCLQKHEVSLWNYKPTEALKNKLVTVIGNSYFSYIKSFRFFFRIFFSKKYFFLKSKEKLLLLYQIARLTEILKESNFDIIHVHSLKNTVPIALQSLKIKTPYVITDHGFWNQKGVEIVNSKSFFRVKSNIKGCAKLIYISNYAKQKHEEIDLNQKNKLIKISNPLTIPNSIIKINKSRKKIIFFNGLTKTIEIKNLPILLKAIEDNEYLNKNIKLIVLSNKAGIKHIKQNTYSFEIEVYGETPWKKVINFYKKSDLLVVPSKSDSFGLVYIEALAYGMPIIGLDKLINEFQKTIQYYIGEPFNPNNESSKDLAQKIIKALQSDFNAQKITEQLKLKFSWKNNVNKYIDVYKQCKKNIK